MDFPKLYPSHLTVYDIDAGMPISCAWNGFMDGQGRLWINPCFGQEEHRTIGFYQFDGQHSESIYWDELPAGAEKGQANLVGSAADGELYGFFRRTGHFFFFDPDTRRTRFYRIGQEDATIIFMKDHPVHGMILLAGLANHQFIYQLRGDSVELLLDYESAIDHDREPEKDRFFPGYQLLAGDDLWFCEARDMVFSGELRKNFKVLRYDLRERRLYRFTLEDLFGGTPPPPPEIFRKRASLAKGPQGGILLADCDHIYRVDPRSGRANLWRVFPHAMDHEAYLFYYRIVSDETGNLLFLFPDGQQRYLGILADTAGQFYDYSPVLETAVKAGRFPDMLLDNVWSRDFKRSLFAFHQAGMVAVDLQLHSSIHTGLEEYGIRAIGEWQTGEYLVNPERIRELFHVDDRADQAGIDWELFVLADQEAQPVGMSSLLFAYGYWWYSSGKQLVRLDSSRTQLSFPIGKDFEKFTFLDSSRVALVTNQNELLIVDLSTHQINPWLENGQPLPITGLVNELRRAADGSLWIATLQGLWRVDLQAGRSRKLGREDGFRDERLMCLEEDEQGRIWMGTYGSGLQIYDPQTGTVQVIDQRGGLSNNTVVGILVDEEGIRWVSTFMGINLVSPQGEVIAQLFEEDGLSNNEFNRYSYFRDSRGRLLFGSVNGVNIIEPESLKEQLRGGADLRIYLTGVTSFDPRSATDSTRNYGFGQMGVISLPAAHRYLELDFALSNLVRPEDHRFYYQIVPAGKSPSANWIFLGHESQLYLPDLSPGRYDILIRGADYRGSWAQEPLVVSVRVAEFFYREVWFYLLLFAVGAGIGLTLLFREVRQRRRLERIVEQRTQKIREDKELIEAQARQLQELDQVKSRFFTNISHEFRTPLTVISGMVTQMRQQPEQWLEKGMELIQRNSSHLLTLINQILDLRKLESGALKVHWVQGDIIPFCRYLADSFSSMAQLKGIRLHFQSSVPELVMDYDPDKMLQILSNLLSNAIKHAPGPAEIFLEIDRTAIDGTEALLLRVRDTGPGIRPQALPFIFDQFYQADPLSYEESTHKPAGSGVGLALTKELVELLGGTIEVASVLGEGTTFTLKFPILRTAKVQALRATLDIPSLSTDSPPQDKAPVVAPPTVTDHSSPEEKIEGERPTLLIVEDHPDVRLYLTACLEPHYHLLTAVDGQQGIDLAIEQVPDLIVSDVMMPVKDGFALCDTLKNDERTSHIPIILLTAKADFESRISGLRRGADAYLTKPFEQEELLVRLEQLLALRRKLQERYRTPSFAEQPAASEEVRVEDVFVQKLRELVLQNLEEEDFGIVQLCRALAVSRTQLHNKVKALTGRSTTEFVRMVRLHQARELLLTTDLNISEVGYEVGISNPAYFSRIYAEAFGESPSQTRRTPGS